MANVGLSTAGAIPIRNKKGELSMQKVKVQRYISGRKPKYADEGSTSEESEDEFISERKKQKELNDELAIHSIIIHDEVKSEYSIESELNDRRLQRLRRREHEEEEGDRTRTRHRHVQEPEVVAFGEGEHRRHNKEDGDSSNDEENDDESVERRHNMLLLKREEEDEEEELLEVEEENESEEDESEYEEYTDSEEETGPRLKPVFVRKKDRITVQEKEKIEIKQKEMEIESKKVAEERRKQTLKIIEDTNRKEAQEKHEREEEEALKASIAAINTDDENEEASYETWKLRELKRLKRDKDERESLIKEKAEVERLRNMTEDERQAELKANPKVVTNKAPKGKYRFLQKYYHRGAFYLDEEADVFKRDFAEPTLEDHFDKTVLPKVMQVKNFGRSGRTKYTHLVDQDTTAFDSPWTGETTQTSKFHSTQAGGLKSGGFSKPTKKRK